MPKLESNCHINEKLFVCLLDLQSRFLCTFYMFGSVRFRFGKQNFDWLVLFGSGRTVKYWFGQSLLDILIFSIFITQLLWDLMQDCGIRIKKIPFIKPSALVKTENMSQVQKSWIFIAIYRKLCFFLQNSRWQCTYFFFLL